MTSLQLAKRGYMAMVGRMVTILPHAPKKSLSYVTLSCGGMLVRRSFALCFSEGIRRA